MTPRISVIMIFYNSGRFIADSIASVAMQSRPDWELVLVDDGSSDDSTAIARAAAADDPRIRYFEHAGHVNLGLAQTRNRGLAEARGEFVLYVDSDDILFPTALAELAAQFEREADLGLSCSATLFWNWDEALSEEPDRMQSFGPWADRTVAGPQFLAAMIVDEAMQPANCGTLMRRQAMLDAGGFTLAVAGIYEDTALMTALLLEHRIHLSSRCLSAYRMHMASHCHTALTQGDYAADRPNAARARFLAWAGAYLDKTGNATPGLDRAIAAAGAAERRRGLASQLLRLAADPQRLRARVRPRIAPVPEALGVLEAFHQARGDSREAARLRARAGDDAA